MNTVKCSGYTSGYIRSDWLVLLAGLFILLVLVFGGMKGVRTLVSLVLTCLAIFRRSDSDDCGRVQYLSDGNRHLSRSRLS